VKAHILLNSSAGSSPERQHVEKALKAAGFSHLHWLDGDDYREAVKKAVACGAKLIVAAGGDGTVSAAAGALAGSEARLGILALGTLNHFARDLGIPAKLEEAARLLANGREDRVDVAEVNGRTFVNTSAIGVYPLMVSDRQSQERRLGRTKRLAMAVASARVLARFSRHRLRLTCGGRSEAVETPLLFVGNNRYRLEMPGAGTRERIDKGELDVLVLRRNSRLGFLVAAARAAVGKRRPSDVLRIDGVDELVVDSDRPSLRVSLDGETEALAPPLRYRIRPKALRVIVPSPVSGRREGK